jgi:hypothetical protein
MSCVRWHGNPAAKAGFPAVFFMIRIADHPIFAALQTRQCCYANKTIASGIWYT